MTPHPQSIVVALGSNLGDRTLNLRRAVALLANRVRLVRLSDVWESEPIDCPPGSYPFLNMVALAWTRKLPAGVLADLHAIEALLGRRRRLPNDPRVIDLDLILYSAYQVREQRLQVPHPRFTARNFVMAPLLELELGWVVPGSGLPLKESKGKGSVAWHGALY